LIRAVLVLALGVSLGHLFAVSQYQRGELDAAHTASREEPALEEYHRYQGLLERRTLAIAADLVLVTAAAVAARSVAEGVALAIVGFGAAGLTAAGELAALGYALLTWPLLPVLYSQTPAFVITAHAAALLLIGLVYYADARREARIRAAIKRPPRSPATRRRSRSPTQSPERRRPVRRPPDNEDEESDDEGS